MNAVMNLGYDRCEQKKQPLESKQGLDFAYTFLDSGMRNCCGNLRETVSVFNMQN